MTEFSTARGDQLEPEGAVAFVTMGLRTLIRGIAFEDKSCRRESAQHLWSPAGLGPGDHPAKTEGEIQTERLPGYLEAAGKSMEDTADAGTLLFAENLQTA